jgi:hypothetical protein
MTFRSSAVIPPLRASSLPAVAAIAIVRTPRIAVAKFVPMRAFECAIWPQGYREGNIDVKLRTVRLSAC